MESEIEKESQQYDKFGIWPAIYQEIKVEAAEIAFEEELSTKEAKQPTNKNRNRYRDVMNKLSILILQRKCHQYWPLGENYGDDEEMVYEDVQLKITLLEERSCNYYIVRTLEIEDMQTSETREILHFNYVTWPDFGVPTSPTAFLNFLMAVRESGGLEPDSGPCVIHCSAGIGRSGTFCLVDSVLVIKSSDDEAPPKPPTRVESLPHRNEPPPLPPRTGFQNTVDNMEGLNSKESVSGTSESQLRRRNREDRKKKTEEQVRKMKDKLRDSELSKKRKSYLKPVAIGLTGLTLLIGGFLIYTFYFKNLGHDKG
ncbi:PTPN1 [Mytilus coruscus]|uniref:protein-tyrosine-phosphatase n=1 Tax=Mytilus coruscus TaxID=42192 RepID=A0A6J8D2Z6_MYTCO|nr:PTPN1 [Mytilus coruscus]